MLVARFFTGVGSSTYSTLVGGVISDVYRPWERNVPMAIFSGGALAGIGLGPLVCGFIGQFSTWRWVFWHQVISNAVLVGCFMYFVPETRESILLRTECDSLNKWVQELEHDNFAYFNLSRVENCGHQAARRVRWTLGDTEGGDLKIDLLSLIATSLARPFVMLYREPIVTYLSLWATFSWSVLYIALAAIPLMFADVYGFTLSQANFRLCCRLHWPNARHHHLYRPGSLVRALAANKRDREPATGEQALFHLRRELSPPCWAFHVWMDRKAGRALGRADHCHRDCYGWHLHHLFVRLQLP